MPDPEGEKGSGLQVQAYQELIITKVVSLEELAVRVQILERVIARAPFLGLDYARELKRAGLEREELFKRTVIPDH